ncbi:dihydrolipoamide acetyltransferase family protein [Pelagibacterium luteolum]|uniref:Dihydrolipoamide acetyltransferase component of pyruvate dehydrogenase complex n=1 Tax=Pelagibacterium luteolum TaxID=440168 RepID=A0A1G7WHI0_9HYPH|nr:dihydrolipoamide acetyltransferase family protein [Pelagibacterium luteolum]SDG71487.1 2-oxoisovalerate dehydrogenase E2 component (dihydrolipoyl transacylase) [Pelagibacterium luteolum]
MKTYLFRLPDIGEGVAEAEITAWYVKEGDHITEDQTLVDVMTDKATIDMTSPVTGTILKRHGTEGDKAPVGSILVEIAVEGEAAATSASPSAAPQKPNPVIPGEDPGPSTLRAPGSPTTPSPSPAQPPLPTGERDGVRGPAESDGPPASTTPTPVIPGEDPGPSTLRASGSPSAPTPSTAHPALPSERIGLRDPAESDEPRASSTPPPSSSGSTRGPSQPLPSHTAGDSIPTHQILASPATRRRAEDLSIDLTQITGTGPEGRITDADLHAVLKSRAPASAPRERHAVHDKKLIGLRRKIAERMELAARTIPHFSYVEDCDMTALETLRREINAARQGAQPKLTLLPFFMRALAQLLPEFPHINAHYDSEGGVLRQFEPIHIGIATQTADGLMVPVVRHVEALDIWDCAREMSRVTNAAREGRASRDELSGSTITLTSLGALGGVAATPIINHPEVAIIGPNKLIARPVAIGTQLTIRTMMNLSSSFDHRIVDGYDAAKFIQRLKRLLENPALIFMEKRSWS